MSAFVRSDERVPSGDASGARVAPGGRRSLKGRARRRQRPSGGPRRGQAAWRYAGWWELVASHGVLTLVAFLAAAPMWIAAVTSLLPEESIATGTVVPPWREATLENYNIAFDKLGFDAMLVNSFVLAASSALASTAIAVAAAFALARYRPRMLPAVLVLLVALISVPPVLIVPILFVQFNEVGLANTYPAAIIAHTGLVIPFSTYFMYVYARGLDESLLEAAAIDGASSLQQFRYIIIPIMRPALVGNALVIGIFSWNELLVPLLLWQTNNLRTLQVGLASVASGFQGVFSIPLMMAAVVITVGPMAFATWLGRNYLSLGLSQGGSKG